MARWDREADFALHSAAELVPERDLQATVEAMLRDYGYRYYHAWDSRHSVSGWPDIFAVKVAADGSSGKAWALELKREGLQPTAAQTEWLDALEAAGIAAHIVWPSGLPELAKMLAADRGKEAQA